jgi:tRNA G10  N-methylase Trm11
MIPSLNFDQSEILSSILNLNELESFDADITFGNGKFYQNMPRPKLCFDIDPQCDFVIKASSDSLPMKNGSVQSLVFDPPFLTYVKEAREHNSIMAKRFGGYWAYDDLANHYQSTLKECARVIATKGILVFKCQDIVHNHKLQPTHINVINWSEKWFRLKDLFVLGAKHRMPIPQQKGTALKKQKHARIFHSYFLVFEKLSRCD